MMRDKPKDFSRYNGLLVDVDHTLLNSQYEIPTGVLSKLEQLWKKGWQIGVCTGRGHQGLVNTVLPEFKQFDPGAHHVIFNGAQVITSSGVSVYDQMSRPEFFNGSDT